MNQISKLIWHKEDTPADIRELLLTLEDEYPVSCNGRGLNLEFRKLEEKCTVSNVIRERGKVIIEYTSVASCARGIGSALAKLDGCSSTSLSTLGVMIDISRNMVMKVDYLKKWLRKLALNGYNMVMLYCEDTYELENTPLFGYMRGAYTAEEIKELDSYAQRLGIEIVGCIQTLGHMEQYLKWKEPVKNVRDTESVLLTNCDETYNLIDEMIKFWSENLSSKRIHVGMDEVHNLGRGQYMDKYGAKKAIDLFSAHLIKVNEICQKYNLTPMIWSDMYFRLTNSEQSYYDLTSPISQEVIKAIPENLQLVYWDYYHYEPEFYMDMIDRHCEFGTTPIVASSIRTNGKFWYDHKITENTIIPCIQGCKEKNVKELFFTLWGDDGAFCNYDSALAGMFFSADLVYGVEDEELIAQKFDILCDSSYEAHVIASSIDNVLENTRDDKEFTAHASMLLWDDPLQGLVFDDFRRQNPEFDLLLLDTFEEIQAAVLPFAECKGAGDFEHISNLVALLIRKLEFRGALEVAYDRGDRLALREIAVNVVPSVISAIKEFDRTFRTQWLNCAKPFGLERIQVRNAGLIARFEETALRIREYLEGKIDRIEELDNRMAPSGPVNLAGINRYAIYSSASNIV